MTPTTKPRLRSADPLSPEETYTETKQAGKPASRHDHRQSIWIIADGLLLWCYRCGAWRENSTRKGHKWYRPSGLNGDNPAMKKGFK